VPLPAAALHFPLSHPGVASVLLGPRTVAELDTNLKLLATEIPDALWGDLAREGLIRGDAPLPAMMDRG
jgi:D-threo-aldose 1-dehydrogenase